MFFFVGGSDHNHHKTKTKQQGLGLIDYKQIN